MATKIRQLKIKGTTYDFALPNNQVDNLLIGDATSAPAQAIVGGGADKSVISGLLGSTASSLFTVKIPTATKPNSISLGSSTEVISTGGNAIGVMNFSGARGYYYRTIDFTNKTITLSTSRSSQKWSPSSTFDWAVGDTISFVNDHKYPACCKITAIKTNVITVDSLPFTSADEIVSYSVLKELTYAPDDFTIFACYQKVEAEVSLLEKSFTRWYCRSGDVELGWAATTFGVENLATGSGSFTSGWNNWAAGDFASVSGRDNTAGYATLVSGRANKVATECAFASGAENIVTAKWTITAGKGNEVKSPYAAALGYSNIAKGNASLSAGYDNETNGIGAAAIGYQSKATGQGAFAAGYNAQAAASGAIALGYNARANSANSIAIGIGTASRSQAIAIGLGSIASYDQATAIAGGNASNQYAVAIGDNSSASGLRSFAAAAGKAGGEASTAFGGGSTTAAESFAVGSGNIASGQRSAIFGVKGDEHIASGTGSMAIGNSTVAAGYCSFVAGNNNVSRSNYSAVFGRHNRTSYQNTFVCGSGNKDVNALFIVGNSSAANPTGQTGKANEADPRTGTPSNAFEVYADKAKVNVAFYDKNNEEMYSSKFALSGHTHTAYVPVSRKINNKALITDLSLSYDDVGAASSNHNHDTKYVLKTGDKGLTGWHEWHIDVTGATDGTTAYHTEINGDRFYLNQAANTVAVGGKLNDTYSWYIRPSGEIKASNIMTTGFRLIGDIEQSFYSLAANDASIYGGNAMFPGNATGILILKGETTIASQWQNNWTMYGFVLNGYLTLFPTTLSSLHILHSKPTPNPDITQLTFWVQDGTSGASTSGTTMIDTCRFIPFDISY